MADAMQPRFVDLVRNYSSSTGTGNFVLGTAVAGFRSFATELQPGDRFYYSAIGIDKPDEFEIGRGTLEADGTISRDPAGGVATDFSNGTKTIALVVAAEWYEAVQAGASSAVASRKALAELADQSRLALLHEPGREGLFVFDANDLSASVAADPAQGIYIAPASDLTGKSGAWVRTYGGAADPRWFGAALDGMTDDTSALNWALQVAKHVKVPRGKTLAIKTGGAITCPDDMFLHILGKIAFNPASGSYAFLVPGTVSNVTVSGPGKISSSLDLEFLHIFRLTQGAGETLDGFAVENLEIEYTDTAHTGGDRWFISATGQGTRKNLKINGNRLTGRMQLTSALVNGGTLKDSEICRNRVHNGAANAISISARGTAGQVATLDNVRIEGNVITADAEGATSLGIFAGLDNSTGDRCTNIKNLTIKNNIVDISASPSRTADIYIRLGNMCANIGGFDSVNDNILISGNSGTTSFQITQPSPATASGYSRITNFVLRDTVRLGNAEASVLRHLGDGATLIANNFDGRVELGCNNGKIVSEGNCYQTLASTDAEGEFALYSRNDTFVGDSTAFNDVPVALNANTSFSQTAEFVNVTVNSGSAGSKRAAIEVLGPGEPAVTVKNFDSSTAWGVEALLETSGTIAIDGGEEWTPNFSYDGTAYIAAREKMRLSLGTGQIGDGNLTYEKSSAATPALFSATALPVELEAGAWLKVTATAVASFCAVNLRRTK